MYEWKDVWMYECMNVWMCEWKVKNELVRYDFECLYRQK